MSESVAERVYAVLLRILPADFRSRYGEQMRRFFADEWRAARGLRRARLISRAIVDVPWTAIVVRASPATYAATGAASNDGGVTADARAALRGLRRRPGFTATAVLTIALGVAATSGVFSVIDATVLRGIGLPNESRVVSLWGTFTNAPGREFGLSLAEYADVSKEVRGFDEVGGWMTANLLLPPAKDRPARTFLAAMTYGSIYSLVGARAVVGRLPGAADDQLSAPTVAVISHRLWTTMYHADPRVVAGETVPIGRGTARIIGVLSPEAALPAERADVWIHRALDPSMWATDRSGHGLNAVARLRHGTTERAARAELASLERTWAVRYAGQHSFGIDGHAVSVALLDDRMLASPRRVGVLLSIASLVLLLLACANVANLMLARGEMRAAEVGVRVALGASVRRVAQPVLLEGLAIASAGGILGLVLATAGLAALMRLSPGEVVTGREVTVDARVVAFAIVVSMLSGVAFALAPARGAARQDPSILLRASGRGRSTSMRGLQWIMGGQTALATLLLIGATLFTRSLYRLNAVHPGLDARSRVTVDVVLPPGRYPTASAIIAFYDQLRQRIDGTGGIMRAAFVRLLPLRDGQRMENVTREGDARRDRYMAVSVQAASVGALRTLGIPLLEGRDLEAEDRLGATRVALINAAAASTLWPGQGAVGKRIHLAFAPDSIGFVNIVGVYGDVRSAGLSATPGSELLLPIAQCDIVAPWLRRMTLVAQSAVGGASGVPTIRAAIHAVDPYVVVESPNTMAGVLRASTARERFLAVLLVVFATLALFIAAVGVFGVVSFAVARQTRELAIRRALGAGAADIARGVLRANAGVAAIGSLLGMAVAAIVGPTLSNFLYGESPRDVVVLGGVPFILVGVAIVACSIPMARAMRVSAASALQDAE